MEYYSEQAIGVYPIVCGLKDSMKGYHQVHFQRLLDCPQANPLPPFFPVPLYSVVPLE